MSELGIAAFIEARLAEDEATARAATAGPWLIDEGDEKPDHSLTIKGGPDQLPDVPGRETVVYSPYIWDETRPDFAHIARHDPARVLAEIAAKRAVVKEHAPADSIVMICRTCSRRDLSEWYGEYFPCPTLRLLAAPYADHPNFRPEWRLA